MNRSYDDYGLDAHGSMREAAHEYVIPGKPASSIGPR